MLSDAELIELEELLKDKEIRDLKEGLYSFNDYTSPNYKALYNSITQQQYNKEQELISGYRGFILEGSSRSTKTWAGVDIIIWLCLFVEEQCTINIYRETYNEFKTTLYDDFKRRLDDFGLDNPFHNAKEIKSFRIGRNTIYFLGDGKHGGGCDYAFFNEMMFIEQSVFDQAEMRCRKFWWGDYNPSFTDHWVFDKVIPRKDVGFLRTTFRDNKFISPGEKNKILGYEPWKPGSYEVTEDGQLLYQGEPIDDKNQPPPHPVNVAQGTADEFMWKVYGLGLRGAMKGVVFPKVKYIDEFPDLANIYGNDFGFTSDPNATVKYAQEGKNIYLQLMCYNPVETATELDVIWDSLGINRGTPIPCDSSDKYTGENKGTVEMVRELAELGWEVFKISKTKSVMYWLLKMKEFNIHIVKDKEGLWKHAKKEQENYRFKEVNGIQINQPVDEYNHFWDASRYAFMSYNEDTYQIFY